jgi:hypothetical protein
MSNATRQFQFLLLTVGVIVSVGSSWVQAEDTPPAANRYALLIGVQKYKNLPEGQQLNGCRNDVLNMQDLLVKRLGFDPAHITVLLDEDATGAAIRQQMQALEQLVVTRSADQPSLQIFFHFSGHGSQVPDQAMGEPDADERDGVDETIVPFDASRQGGSEDIRDDELNHFCENISQGGKHKMFMLLDCCHSGSGSRGTTRLRQLDRSIPARTVTDGDNTAVIAHTNPPGVVTLSACRDREVEPEFELNGVNYGLLTHFFIRVVTESHDLDQMSYDLLRKSIVSRYRREPGVMQPPVPQLEGDGTLIQETFLGIGREANRPAWHDAEMITGQPAHILIKAGSFHGMTVGSLFELYDQPEKIVWKPTADQKSNSLGWISIEKVSGSVSTGKFFQWKGDQKISANIPTEFKGGVVIERQHEIGNFMLRVKVAVAENAGTDQLLEPDQGEKYPDINKALSDSAIGDDRGWCRWVDQSTSGDVVIRISQPYAAVFPVSGRSQIPEADSSMNSTSTIPRTLKGGWGPIDLRDADASVKLRDMLRKICKARNLIRLSESQASSTEQTATKLPLKLELVSAIVDSATSVIKSVTPYVPVDGALTVRTGDLYAYRVTNLESSGKPWYVTILHIDADMGIEAILPYQDGDGDIQGEQELKPGQPVISDAFKCIDGFGSRTVVVLATREPNQYYKVSQESLQKVRSMNKGELSSNSSVEDILMEQVWFKTRDVRKRPQKLYDDSWTTSVLTFEAMPRPAPNIDTVPNR